ncbi:TerD family protein [Mucilaginibacter antarcticus]
MAINLEKGQRISLEKSDGKKLQNICVGINWGAIVKKVFWL